MERQAEAIAKRDMLDAARAHGPLCQQRIAKLAQFRPTRQGAGGRFARHWKALEADKVQPCCG